MLRMPISGRKIGDFLAGSTGRPISRGADKTAADSVVCLLDAPRRSPGTSIEARLHAILRQTGPVSLASLVKTVAADLYAEEVGEGAGVLDIGLFGDRLFDRDVLRELKAGDGILWEIQPKREIA